MSLDNLSIDELVTLYDEISNRVLELTRKEAQDEKSEIILEVGKSYKTASGDTIYIYDRYLSVFKGNNPNGKTPSDKLVEFYINGRRSKNKITKHDIISGVK